MKPEHLVHYNLIHLTSKYPTKCFVLIFFCVVALSPLDCVGLKASAK